MINGKSRRLGVCFSPNFIATRFFRGPIIRGLVLLFLRSFEQILSSGHYVHSLEFTKTLSTNLGGFLFSLSKFQVGFVSASARRGDLSKIGLESWLPAIIFPIER